MGLNVKRRIAGMIVVVAAGAAALVVLLGAAAGAKPARHVKTVPLLSLHSGGFEISLGDPPEWMPLSGTAQTLTLFAGAPLSAGASADNAYVGFTSPGSNCAATPAASKSTYYTFRNFFSRSHTGSHAGAFAPNGGASTSSYVESIPKVVVHQSSMARACVWLATNIGAAPPVKRNKHHKKIKPKPVPRSEVASIVVPLLNRTFAASVSNLSGATPGAGGYSMYAIDGGHTFRYSVSTLQCRAKSTDALATVAAGTPASESISISTSPCTTDASNFTFTGADVHHTLSFSITDATAVPSVAVGLGGCELDPLTGTSLTAAETYLTQVGCKLGQVEITPYQSSLPRGAVAWASVDGGVAELAPARTTVDLVINGTTG